MSGIRWQSSTALTLFAVFALCFGLQETPTPAAKGDGRTSRSTQRSTRKPSPSGQMNAGRGVGSRAGASPLNAKNPLVKKIIQIQNRNHTQLVSQKGIYGTGTGLDDDGNIVIRLYTTGADSPQIPKSVEGIPVVEVMTGPIFPAQATSGKPGQQQQDVHPVPIGVSVYYSNSCKGVGTLGCRLRDQNGNVYALGSNHVFCGDSVTYPIGAAPFTAAYVSAYPTFPTATSGNPSAMQATILGTTAVAITQPAALDENCQVPQPASQTIGTLFVFVPFNDQTVPPTPPRSQILTEQRPPLHRLRRRLQIRWTPQSQRFRRRTSTPERRLMVTECQHRTSSSPRCRSTSRNMVARRARRSVQCRQSM